MLSHSQENRITCFTDILDAACFTEYQVSTVFTVYGSRLMGFENFFGKFILYK